MEDRPTATRGVRGATTVPVDDPEAVRAAVAELLAALREENGTRQADVAALIFTVTDDLPNANPAAAAREEGWHDVPLLVVREHGGGADPARCVRLLALWNTHRSQDEIRHVYLREAAGLRPDLP